MSVFIITNLVFTGESNVFKKNDTGHLLQMIYYFERLHTIKQNVLI